MRAVPFNNTAAAPPAAKLSALRELLREKFPAEEQKPSGCWPTGFSSVDGAEGGLRRGALTEISASPGNGALFMDLVLRGVSRAREFAALVDAGDSFDPDGCDGETLSRLLWVRCADAAMAVKAVDLLLRDGNLPVLLLDLQNMSALQLARVPPNTWHRFQRLAEKTAVVCLVFTRRPVVESARVRITLRNTWTLEAQRKRRGELLAALEARVIPRRTAGTDLSAFTPAAVRIA